MMNLNVNWKYSDTTIRIAVLYIVLFACQVPRIIVMHLFVYVFIGVSDIKVLLVYIYSHL